MWNSSWIVNGLIMVFSAVQLNGSIVSADLDGDDHRAPLNTDYLEALDIELLALNTEFEKQTVSTFYEIIDHANSIMAQEMDSGKKSETPLVLYSIAANELKYAMNSYVTQRRMITGLSVNMARQFQDSTNARHLQSLLADSKLPVVASSKVNLRKKFPRISDKELAKMIQLIEVRTRYRALDDIFVLSSTNFKKIFQMAQFYGLNNTDESTNSTYVTYWSLRILLDYYKNILEYSELLSETQLQTMDEMNYSLAEETADDGGHEESQLRKETILAKLDNIINDALDIQLSEEAQELDLPPTITEEMIDNLVAVWLPKDIVNDYKRVIDVLIEAGLESNNVEGRKQLASQLDSVEIGPEETLNLIDKLKFRQESQ